MTVQPAVYLLPIDKDPVLVAADFFSGVVEGYTYVNGIRLLNKPHVTSNIRHVPVDIAETVKDLGWGKGRVGIESGTRDGSNCFPSFRKDIRSLPYTGKVA